MNEIHAVPLKSAADDVNKKRKRGRPRRDGAKSLDAGRCGMALYWFGRATGRGEKYESGLQIAAKEAWISTAEVKRMRAAFQPRDAAVGLITIGDFRPLTPLEEDLIAYAESHGIGPRRPKNPRILMLGFGPIPRYPRTNARSEPRPKTRKNSQEHSRT